MKEGRLTVRFPPQYRRWLAEVGGDESVAVRGLVALAAAQLGFVGADAEALRLLSGRVELGVLLGLLGMSAERQTNGRHTADIPLEEEVPDPFAVGIEV